MKRRDFLRQCSLFSIGLGLSWQTAGVAWANPAAAPQSAAPRRILVAINLFGGNDGLNTVVPLKEYDRYRRLRPTLGLSRERILTLPDASDFGFNASLSGINDLYNQGKVAIVAGVGLPLGTRGLFDHEQSQIRFQAGSSSSGLVLNNGWIGRYLDSVKEEQFSPGVNFGAGTLLLRGDNFDPLSIDRLERFQLTPPFDRERTGEFYRRLRQLEDEDAVSKHTQTQRNKGLMQSEIVQQRARAYQAKAQYPENNPVASTLQQCAALITANLGIVSLGLGYNGFDTHVQQNIGGNGRLGNHDQLLKNVSDAVAAFQADITAQQINAEVVTLIFSEFGRTPRENSDRGTDHGFGSVMLVVGNSVKGGVYGEYPSIEENRLISNQIAVTTDLRSVYATILAKHLQADPGPIFEGDFPLLAFL
jgi:uncharacterized protein (DUF1501 family)